MSRPTKICNACGIEKSVNEFHKRNLKSGVLSYKENCKCCANAKARDITTTTKSIYIPDLKDEMWKPILGFETYLVSSLGRVKSLSKINRSYTKLIPPRLTVWGYLSIPLYYNNDGSFKRKSIHRLVAIAFIQNPLNKPCVNHINNIKTDNRVENLEWCIHQENTNHIKKQKRFKIGGQRHNTILTAEKVLEIFNSNLQQRDLAKVYKVNQGTIAKIKTGQNWSHVTGKSYQRAYAK